MAEDTKLPGEAIDRYVGDYLGKAEVAVYHVVGVLLTITAAAGIASAAHMLWKGFVHWTIATETLRVLDQLLLVLMLVEIFTPFASLSARTFFSPWSPSSSSD